MSTITINEVELELDMMDADVAERVESAMEKVNTESSKIAANPSLKLSESIRLGCRAVFECFNTIFGEGTDEKIFGNQSNLSKCLIAIGELRAQITQSTDRSLEEINAKYLPNRDVRHMSAENGYSR